MVGADLGVDPLFDIGEFGRGDRGEMREVEAQAIRGDQGTLLRHVLAQHRAQRRVQQVGRAVVEHRRRATRRTVQSLRDELEARHG